MFTEILHDCRKLATYSEVEYDYLYCNTLETLITIPDALQDIFRKVYL